MSKITYIEFFIIGVALLVFSGIGLFHTNLDSRAWMLISISFASGIMLTKSILGLTSIVGNDKTA